MKSSIPKTQIHIPRPRMVQQGDAETILAFVEKCAGRKLFSWEADVLLTLIRSTYGK